MNVEDVWHTRIHSHEESEREEKQMIDQLINMTEMQKQVHQFKKHYVNGHDTWNGFVRAFSCLKIGHAVKNRFICMNR